MSSEKPMQSRNLIVHPEFAYGTVGLAYGFLLHALLAFAMYVMCIILISFSHFCLLLLACWGCKRFAQRRRRRTRRGIFLRSIKKAQGAFLFIIRPCLRRRDGQNYCYYDERRAKTYKRFAFAFKLEFEFMYVIRLGALINNKRPRPHL